MLRIGNLQLPGDSKHETTAHSAAHIYAKGGRDDEFDRSVLLKEQLDVY